MSVCVVMVSGVFVYQGIQITATTPTSNAVRLETGCIELELSNRVQTASKDGTAVKNTAPKVNQQALISTWWEQGSDRSLKCGKVLEFDSS